MSEKILKALLKLFAIIARVEGQMADGRPGGRGIVERFLRQQFDREQVGPHLLAFDAFVQAYHNSGGENRKGRKRTSLNSVKVLKICTEINEELTHRQKFVVLVHLLEFIHEGGEVAEQELEFVNTVAETFNIGHGEYERIQRFVDHTPAERDDEAHLLYIDAAERNRMERARHLHAHGIDGELRVLHVPSVQLYVARYQGSDRVLLNGQPMHGGQHYVLGNGSVHTSAPGRTHLL